MFQHGRLRLHPDPVLAVLFLVELVPLTICYLENQIKVIQISSDSLILSAFRSFFGRIEETINCFRDLLTFSTSSQSHRGDCDSKNNIRTQFEVY